MFEVNRKPFTILFVLLCAIFIVSCVTASSNKKKHTLQTEPSLIICLGGSTRDRVNHSVSLIKTFPDINILFSGKGSAKNMADHAKKQYPKLKDDQIILENKSYDTIGNAIYSRKLLQKYNFRNIVLVTNDYHMKRSLYIFRRVFGSEYKITPSPAKSTGKISTKTLEKEEKHLLYTKIMFAGIASGDVDGFEKRATLLDPKFPKPQK